MSDVERDLANDTLRANTAAFVVNRTIENFTESCMLFDWKRAEQAREVALAALDCYFDNVAAVWKRIESDQPKRDEGADRP